MTSRFSDQVALIAGGTGVLGRSVALAFLREGAKVVVTYRNPREFEDLQSAAKENNFALQGHAVDVTDHVATGKLTQQILEEHGRLDVMVNTVGAYAGGVRLWESDPIVFDRMLTLNLQSGYILCRAVVPVMLKQKKGSIVNVASRAAVDHAAGAAAYAASKAGAVAMIDSLAADLRGTGVRVNSILPSIIDTEANRKAMPSADFSQWPKPEEIAQVILFLCSEDGRLIHGASVPVYGNS